MISDSFLACQVSKEDSTWLNIQGFVDVVRGRSFCKHEWALPHPAADVHIFCAGNDFQKKGNVKGALPWDFDEKVKAHVLSIRAKTQGRLTFVLCGDWADWQKGFHNADPHAGG